MVRFVVAPGRVTIRDVAERAGVSIATVSKVINERYGVAAATSEKVQAVIHDLGYESSLVARSLRNHRTNVIGILVSDIEPFSAELLKGAARAIKTTGYELVVYSSGGRGTEHVGWESRALSRLSGTLIDGAVLVTPTVVAGSFGAPVVAVDPHTGREDMPTVDSDNRTAPGSPPSTCSSLATAGSASSVAARTSSPPGCASSASATRWPRPGSTSTRT